MTKRPEVGSRVGAILSHTGGVVGLLGYGVYLGDLPAPPAVFQFTEDEWAEITADWQEEKDYVDLNPCILLDSGSHVWGCQCWWGTEENIKRRIDESGDTVVHCSLPDIKPVER